MYQRGMHKGRVKNQASFLQIQLFIMCEIFNIRVIKQVIKVSFIYEEEDARMIYKLDIETQIWNL